MDSNSPNKKDYSTYTKLNHSYYRDEHIIKNDKIKFDKLLDGRQRDIVTQKVIHQQTSCVYEVCEPSGEILMVETLSEAATAVGVYPDTLSRHLDVEVLDSERHFVELKNHKVRRVPVFCR